MMTELRAREQSRDAQYWRDRAEECRTKAENMIDRFCRETLLHHAEGYEGMAKRADQRARCERGR